MADEPPKEKSVLSWIRDTTVTGEKPEAPPLRQDGEAGKEKDAKPAGRPLVRRSSRPSAQEPETPEPAPRTKGEQDTSPTAGRPGVIQYVLSIIVLLGVTLSPIPQRYVTLIYCSFIFVILAEISYRLGQQYFLNRRNEEKLDIILKSLGGKDKGDLT